MSLLAFLQNIGFQELIIIMIIALLIFGPKNLPKLGRMMGRSVREFRDATNRMTDSLTAEEEENRRPARPDGRLEANRPVPEPSARPVDSVREDQEKPA